jgi:DNA-binding CsgD family transcriptional regulator/tetratricopeptide (TPR) repeat protein
MLRGRDSELAMLDRLLQDARKGRGAAVELAGNTGMGKTALLGAARARASDFLFLQVEGVETENELSFAGLHQLLRTLLPDREISSLVSSGNTFTAYSEMTGVLANAARERPVLCCVDNFDLLDPVSRAGLIFAARRLTTEPVVLLLACPPDLSTGLRRVPLGPLDDVAAQRLLEDQVPGGLPEDLTAELLSLGCGNPLALTELASALTPAQLAGTVSAPVSLPAESRLRAHYRQRYEALSPTARRLVLLAVTGEWLGLDTLVSAAAEAGIDLRALDEATASGLLHVRGEQVGVPTRLLRSCLYTDAPLTERRTTHLLLASVLDHEQRHLDALLHRAATTSTPDERLADELDQAAATARKAKDYESSSRAYELAAELTPDRDARALRLLTAARDCWLAGYTYRSRSLLRRLRPILSDDAMRGMADLLEGEMELRDGVPDVGHQNLLDAAELLAGRHVPLAASALMRAGEASVGAGHYHDYFDTGKRVSALVGSGAPPLLQLMVDHFAGVGAALQGRYAEAKEPLHRVIELASSQPGCAPKIWGCVAALALGDDTLAHTMATHAVNAARAEGSPANVPRALEFVAHVALRLDNFSTAVNTAMEGLRLAEAAGQHVSVANLRCVLALTAAYRGDKKTAQSDLEKAAEHATARGLPWPRPLGSWAMACIDLTEDRPAEALSRLSPLLATDRPAGGSPFARVTAIPHFVEAAVQAGERETARVAVDTLDSWAQHTGNPGHMAVALRCRALLVDGEEADELFQKALLLHPPGGRPFERAKTELFFGERLRRGRKPRAAREHLRNARQTFQRYDAAYWAERAGGELRAAGESVTPVGGPGMADLTPQQTQIARLVAEGATNREVAAQLFVSPRTVDHHLRNIFTKLGIRSRVELTTFFR